MTRSNSVRFAKITRKIPQKNQKNPTKEPEKSHKRTRKIPQPKKTQKSKFRPKIVLKHEMSLLVIYISIVFAVHFTPLLSAVDVHSILIRPRHCQTYADMSVHDVRSVRRFEHETARNNVDLKLRFPRQYLLLRCLNVTLKNGRPIDTPDDAVNIRTVEAPTFLASDLFMPFTFQHTFINGAASLGMVWRSLQRIGVEQIASVGALHDILQHVVRINSSVELTPDLVRFDELYIAAPLWKKRDDEEKLSTWDCYAVDVLRYFIPSYFEEDYDIYDVAAKKIMYLPRPPNTKRHLSARRCDANCTCSTLSDEEFVSLLEKRVREEGWEFEVFQQKSQREDAEAIRRADVLVGPHGGAFTNLVWMHATSAIVEVNVAQRLCFACLAGAANLLYYRYEPLSWPGYETVGDIVIDADDFIDYVSRVANGDLWQISSVKCKT